MRAEFREEFLEPEPSLAFLSDVESASREENAPNQNARTLHRLREAVKDFRPRFLDRLVFKIQIDERELDDVELDDAKSFEAVPYEAEPYEAEPYEAEPYETEPYEPELASRVLRNRSYEPERREPRFDEPALTSPRPVSRALASPKIHREHIASHCSAICLRRRSSFERANT